MNKFFKKEVKKISVIFQKDETLGASHVNTPKEGPIKVLKSRPTPEICWHRTWHIEKYLINVCSVTEWVNWLVPVKCLKNLCMNLTYLSLFELNFAWLHTHTHTHTQTHTPCMQNWLNESWTWLHNLPGFSLTTAVYTFYADKVFYTSILAFHPPNIFGFSSHNSK